MSRGRVRVSIAAVVIGGVIAGGCGSADTNTGGADRSTSVASSTTSSAPTASTAAADVSQPTSVPAPASTNVPSTLPALPTTTPIESTVPPTIPPGEPGVDWEQADPTVFDGWRLIDVAVAGDEVVVLGTTAGPPPRGLAVWSSADGYTWGEPADVAASTEGVLADDATASGCWETSSVQGDSVGLVAGQDRVLVFAGSRVWATSSPVGAAAWDPVGTSSCDVDTDGDGAGDVPGIDGLVTGGMDDAGRFVLVGTSDTPTAPGASRTSAPIGSMWREGDDGVFVRVVDDGLRRSDLDYVNVLDGALGPAGPVLVGLRSNDPFDARSAGFDVGMWLGEPPVQVDAVTSGLARPETQIATAVAIDDAGAVVSVSERPDRLGAATDDRALVAVSADLGQWSFVELAPGEPASALDVALGSAGSAVGGVLRSADGFDGVATVWFSTDRMSWSPAELAPVGFGEDGVTAIASFRGGFVAVTDGSVWTSGLAR